MFEKISSFENLLQAWQEFLPGKRYKPDVVAFSLHLMGYIFALHRDLRNRTYRHGGYTEFCISDPKPRRIHKAPVRDRLLHHAVNRVLYPVFDRAFIPDSFSCRIGKGTHAAFNRFQTFARQASRNNTRTCWVLKCDIQKFFANVDHEILLGILAKRVDASTASLLHAIIGSFSSAGRRGVGLPLGNLTSQLFANIYMNEFDQFVKHKLTAKHYVRYADDFVLLSHDKNHLAELLLPVHSHLSERLRLALHPDKVSLQTLASGVDFLGWVHFPDHRVLRTATKRRMLRRIAEYPATETLQSYRGLLRHGNAWKLGQALDVLESRIADEALFP